MSIQQLKELFGNQEAVLELVQLEGGELALRNAGSENEPLVKIQFSDEVKAILGEQTPVVAQHMIQPATRLPAFPAVQTMQPESYAEQQLESAHPRLL